MSFSQERLENIYQYQVGQYTPRDKTIAAPWQVAALQQLMQRAGDSPPKEDIVQTGKETGLYVCCLLVIALWLNDTAERNSVHSREVRWIRNWLSRQRRSRARSGEGSGTSRKREVHALSVAPASTKPTGDISGSSQASSEENTSIQQSPQTQKDSERRNKRKREDICASIQGSAAEPSCPYIQIAKPGTSFSLPLHSSPQASSNNNSVAPGDLLQADSGTKTRALTQSPSLGYIPLAFPMTYSQPPGAADSELSVSSDTSLNSNNSGTSSDPGTQESQVLAGTQTGYPMMYSEHFMPIIPTLPPDYTYCEPTESQRSSNMFYLSQLLLDASDTHAPHLATGPLGDSQYVSELYPASFAPSLQSHSTSVLGAVSMKPAGHYTRYLPYPPPPVAFKARVTDLAMLTKRIRATYEDSMGGGSANGSYSGYTPRECADVWHAECNVEDCGANTSATEPEVSTESLLRDASADSTKDAALALALEEDDSDADEEELLTPAGDLPSFMSKSPQPQGPTILKGKGKGKQVMYEDGVLAEVA